MIKTLRPYQEAAVASIFEYFEHHDGNPLIVAPVGAGKSLIMAEFIKRAQTQFPDTSIMVLAHVKELLEQNRGELESQFPGADASYYCAGLDEKVATADTVFASIQSIRKKAYQLQRLPDLLLIDECHLISHNQETMYQKFISDLKVRNPKIKVIGLTGTPFRADSGRLDEGEGRIFDSVAYDIGIGYLIKEGYLCEPVSPKVRTRLSVEGVGSRGGDYIVGQLEDAVNTETLNMACVDEVVELGKDRKRWLVFTVGIAHCTAVMNEFRDRDIVTEMITGETPSNERADIINRYNRGEIKCLVNVAVLTTGFNSPAIDLLAFMRPTRSPVLYIQCVGRGLRTSPDTGKADCLVLDFGGVIDNLGPIDQIEVRKPNKGEGEAPTKICPACAEVCYAGVRVCICGYEFLFEETHINDSASESALLASQRAGVWYEVLGMNINRHSKKLSVGQEADIRAGDSSRPPDTLKVEYVTTAGSIAEWVCFEHKGYARSKAVQWHIDRAPDQAIPDTIEGALLIDYPQPTRINAKKDGKYWRIVKFDNETPDVQETIEGELDLSDIPF